MTESGLHPVLPDTIDWRVRSLAPWHHRIALPSGLVTPGLGPIDPARYRLPSDMTGKRVLDACPRDGYWTFEAVRRGASEVIALGDATAGDSASAENQRFEFCRSAFGYDILRCRRVNGSVYEISEDSLGRFDIVLFFDALHRLRYPLLALERLAAVCTDELYVETAVADFYSPYRGESGRGYDGDVVMELYPDGEYDGDRSVLWAPTSRCLAAMMVSVGFDQVRSWRPARGSPGGLERRRAFACGKRTGG